METNIDLKTLAEFSQAFMRNTEFTNETLEEISPRLLYSSFLFYQQAGVIPPERHPNGQAIFAAILEKEVERHRPKPYEDKIKQIKELHAQGCHLIQISILTKVKISIIKTILLENETE